MSVNSSSMSERDFQRFVGIDGFDGGKPGILDNINRAHAQQHLFLDDKDRPKSGGLTWGHIVGHFHLEPTD